jgi:16S rRNA (cytidine1402-2'-O)-methyltransferase
MPAGVLHVVATPIGNLGDASARSIEVLKSVHVIACEDTRTSRPLLARFGIATRPVALHQHNERAATADLIESLREGKDVALISDAGTPGVSDPGALLVAAAHREGIRVTAIPGASAAIAAFSAAGFPGARFQFAGFLPSSGGARRAALESLDGASSVVLYEAPHRIRATVASLAERFGGTREVVIARELTKKFEEIVRLPLGDAGDWLEKDAHRQQGEFVLVLGPAEREEQPDEAEVDRVLGILLEALPASEAARLAARITRVPRNALYRKALARTGG